MYQRSTVMMTMLEIDRLKVIQTVESGDLRSSVAAERLGMSARQVRWAAPGFMDTLIRWKMEPEVAHGYAKGLYERVQG